MPRRVRNFVSTRTSKANLGEVFDLIIEGHASTGVASNFFPHSQVLLPRLGQWTYLAQYTGQPTKIGSLNLHTLWATIAAVSHGPSLAVHGGSNRVGIKATFHVAGGAIHILQ